MTIIWPWPRPQAWHNGPDQSDYDFEQRVKNQKSMNIKNLDLKYYYLYENK